MLCGKRKMQVYETTDYAAFKRLKGNRDPKHIEMIIKSIETVGYIPNPILVNENGEIIDGQNRFEALVQLDMPILYYVVPRIGIDEARAMNLGQANWGPGDYVKSYADCGNENYVYLCELMKRYPFTLQEVVGVLFHTIIDGGHMMNIVKNGGFNVTSKVRRESEAILDEMIDLLPAIKKIPGAKRTLVTGLAWCMSCDGVNIERMKTTIMSKYPLIDPVCSAHHLLENVETIYNKGLAKNKRVYFTMLYKLDRI